MFSLEQYKWPAKEGRKPFNHQIHTVKFLLENKRAYVLNEMGTGKTLSALWATDILFEAKRIRKVLIIGPLISLESVWAKEIFFNLPHRKYGVAHGSRDKRVAVIKSNVQYVIINHDGIKTCLDELIFERFDIIIIDELTAFKSMQSDRTKDMINLANSAKAVWGLTGQPTPNSPIEAFGQCKVVNPQNPYVPRYFSQFRNATMYQVNDYLWLPKPNAPEIVSLCMRPAIRYTRAECLDLPATLPPVSLPVPFTQEQTDWYERMRKEAYIEYERGEITAVNAAVKLNKLLQISAGSVKTDAGEIIQIDYKPRFQAVVDIWEQTPQKKLVVFGMFVDTIRRLTEDLNKRKIRADFIYGDVPHKHRAAKVDAFQGDALDIIVLQPASTAHAITLVAASTAFWFSLVPSNELYSQGRDRIIRMGQIRQTQMIHAIGSKADQHMEDILTRKGDMSRATLALFTNQEL